MMKVNDKVKLISKVLYPQIPKGTTGTVTRVDYRLTYPVEVKFDIPQMPATPVKLNEIERLKTCQNT